MRGETQPSVASCPRAAHSVATEVSEGVPSESRPAASFPSFAYLARAKKQRRETGRRVLLSALAWLEREAAEQARSGQGE